ncbi:MAG TPA: hypothetical protein VG498_18560 [Terriglobales bacterium]|nr:hypothetical protein [Terriglobales bacterium]
MRASTAILLVLLSSFLLAQKKTDQRRSPLVERAKQVIISSFDPALPNITLESFLNYETQHAPTDWQTNNCKEYPLYLADTERGSAVCVESYSSLSDQRVLKVTLGLTRDSSRAARLVSVVMIKNGLEHPMRLIQVPAAIQDSNFPPPSRRYPLRDVWPLGRVA